MLTVNTPFPLCNDKADAPQMHYMADYFERYKKHRHMTSDDLGKKIGISGAAVRKKLSRDDSEWRIREIEEFCIILDCPFCDAIDELKLNYRKGEKRKVG